MAEGNRLPSLGNAPHLKTDGEFFRISTLQRHHYRTSSYTYQFSKNVILGSSLQYRFSKIIPSFFTIKEGSTSHLGLLQWSLRPLRFPRSRGTETSGEREETALLGARNRYALRLAGHQSPRHGCAGWDRLGTAC